MMSVATDEWQQIHAWLRKVEDKDLGEVFREYVEESVHGGWDGFRTSDVTGIRRMLLDLARYEMARGEGR